MNHEIMTIEEVAEYLRVSERTVYDWAQKGQLPGGKLGTTWRFKRSEVEKWVNHRLDAPAAPIPKSSDATLTRILSPDRVVFLDGAGKDNALQTLCAVLATSSEVSCEKTLSAAIFRREELMSTGIGLGLGIPHVRIPSVSNLVMALGIARTPLSDYVSLDDVPVQIVCMVAAGAGQHPQYIRVLSAISSHLKEASVREAIVSAKDARSAYQLFTGGER